MAKRADQPAPGGEPNRSGLWLVCVRGGVIYRPLCSLLPCDDLQDRVCSATTRIKEEKQG